MEVEIRLKINQRRKLWRYRPVQHANQEKAIKTRYVILFV
jgi:hypothetical protein